MERKSRRKDFKRKKMRNNSRSYIWQSTPHWTLWSICESDGWYLRVGAEPCCVHLVLWSPADIIMNMLGVASNHFQLGHPKCKDGMLAVWHTNAGHSSNSCGVEMFHGAELKGFGLYSVAWFPCGQHSVLVHLTVLRLPLGLTSPWLQPNSCDIIQIHQGLQPSLLPIPSMPHTSCR